MSLTAEQIGIRATGLGASELPAVAGLSPFASPLDLWLRKVGIVASDSAGPAAEVGSELEDSLARLFVKRTGLGPVHLPRVTLRHPERPWQLASPDVLVGEDPERPKAVCELKVVGFGMRGHWEDGVPAYVRAQVAQQQEVMGHVPDWYVGRLIGTDFRVYRIDRDRDVGAEVTRIGDEFWHEYVIPRTPPPPAATESHLEYVKKLHAQGGESGVILPIPPHHSARVAEMIERYRELYGAFKAAEKAKGDAEAALCELVGSADGIEGEWGKFTWKKIAGHTNWKAVAEALTEELGWPRIPKDLVEQHRGDGFRRVYDSKSKLWKARKGAERRQAA